MNCTLRSCHLQMSTDLGLAYLSLPSRVAVLDATAFPINRSGTANSPFAIHETIRTLDVVAAARSFSSTIKFFLKIYY